MPDSFAKSSNIICIWAVWFSSTFFMIIILLNFLIAVISATYERVVSQQTIFSYLHKAELNLESYELLSVFTTLKQYKVIVFSYSKEA
jgi:hypothetical protein